ncbi:ComE operon protein 2 [Alkalihalobacillus sp. AL-G]|uniref:ComE operon protein 2 n=1 Tax=Alkalihalobacillus sp. AL-G TaxID=2926399 RepID=UPI00272AA626|nr:ComE operon protein 2 [Alkalihalobacillus sp. AL-G]WLD92147.1 ComE operon protein 2 [Alkalihalobacillus sp. AL-G]
MDRISWNQYFMAQSTLLAMRSTCERLKVGATIVRDKRIIAGGYNGSISGGEHCLDEGCYVIDGHCVRTVHAEMNALLQCAKFGVATENAEIYVTHFPCLQCCKSIVQAGIKKVYYAKDYKNHPYAIQLFKQAGVQTELVRLEEHYDLTSKSKRDLSSKMLHELRKLGASEEKLSEFEQDYERIYELEKEPY